MATILSKANFMSGLQCHKHLWLEVQEPHRATALTPTQQRIVDQGEEVGQYARQHRLKLVQALRRQKTEKDQDSD